MFCKKNTCCHAKFLRTTKILRKVCQRLLLLMTMTEKWRKFLYTEVHADMEHRINKIHERALRLFYPNQNRLTFEELLVKKQGHYTPEKFANPCK